MATELGVRVYPTWRGQKGLLGQPLEPRNESESAALGGPRKGALGTGKEENQGLEP